VKKLFYTILIVAAASANAETVLQYRGFGIDGEACTVNMKFSGRQVSEVIIKGKMNYSRHNSPDTLVPMQRILNSVLSEKFKPARNGEVGTDLSVSAIENSIGRLNAFHFEEKTGFASYVENERLAKNGNIIRKEFKCRNLRLEPEKKSPDFLVPKEMLEHTPAPLPEANR